ncbi:hypothetical protein AB0M47_29505, partial [Hamadaea sp. NPDC051192]|uniref:hypothetical protein n=1 Tax=Hamadaea sp. NPDC051192 TaxID=3154940 RepID=UPI00343CC542
IPPRTQHRNHKHRYSHIDPITGSTFHVTPLAEVTGQREDHRKIAAAHREAAGAHRDAADEARRRAAAADEHVRHAAALATIAGQAATAAAERPEVETARATAANLVTQAARIRAAAASEVTNQKELAAAARARRVDFERERRDIPVEADAPDPGGNVEVLRSAWQTLRTELSMAERDMIEAAHLERARDRLAATTERLARFQAPEVDLAEKLAGTISASSPETLQEAQRRADRAARELRLAFIRAEHEREQAGQAVREAAPPSGDRNNHIDFATAPQWRPVLPGDVPSLLARLEAHNTDVLSRLNAAIAEETDTVQLQDALSVDVSGFTDTADLWPHDPIPTVSVYTGSKDAAREQMRTLIKQNREAEAQERAATNDLRTAIQQVHSAANEPRWKDLDTPAAVRVRSLPDPDLVTEAPVLAQRLRTMAESAAADLRDLDTHRAILRDELVAVCRDQRRLLREVSRTSRLPDGLGDLSNQPAIKIRFDEAPDAEAAARLADRIDAWAIELAANPKRAQSTDVRSRWLADAIRDTVVDRPRAGPWTIEILKPRIDGKVVYCPPDRIPQEFSGGQVLTLAVLVYCALSGVRSSHRPGGARPPGTLILDNPFGAASAEALIAMQHRLAARTGLQLVCATGLHDAGVDAAFSGTGSVIVKLRNDGDLRRNLSFLRLRTRVVDGVDVIAGLLGGRDPSAPQNWVDATTYEIRP